MENQSHLTDAAHPADAPCDPETDRLSDDARRLWEIRERVRADSERSVIQRAWDTLLGPSRDR